MGGGIGSVLYTDSSVDGADDEDGESESRRFFIYNAIGSTVALTNTASAVMSADCYDAFGKVVASLSGSNDDENRKFCTKERSESIGLDNFGFRYYDYELGRFLTRDPLGYPDGPNNTLYCNNNPVNKFDPLGLKEKNDSGFDWKVKLAIVALILDIKMQHDMPEYGIQRQNGCDPVSSFITGSSLKVGELYGATQVAESFVGVDWRSGTLLDGKSRGRRAGIEFILSVTHAKPVAKVGKALFRNIDDVSRNIDDALTMKIQKTKTKPRTEPVDLKEKLTMDEAKAGAGKKMEKVSVNDTKYKDTHNKMSHNHNHGDGTKTEVHSWKDKKTGETSGHKFKDGPDNLKSRKEMQEK